MSKDDEKKIGSGEIPDLSMDDKELTSSQSSNLTSENMQYNYNEVEVSQVGEEQLPRFCPDGNIYIIRRGDTLAEIAVRFGSTEAAIFQANPFLRFTGLIPGIPICIPIARPPVTCPGGFFHTVQAGETLFSIAARYNTTVEAIIRANPGIDPNRLFVGQRICIPVVVPPPVTCPGGFFYTVQAGDTLFSIATRFNISVEAIIRANPGLDPSRLFVGQRLCIPAAPPPACPGFLYTVQTGDNLFRIAQRFNTTVEAILRVNPGLDPNRIFIGQQICIPRTPTPVCPGFFYTVVAGDTLFSISRRFNTTVEAILRVNPGLDPDRIFVGQRICIPTT